MVYTTYLWWFGGWFTIVLPTLSWLVVYLWKSWSSSVGMIFPNWMESHKIHVPNHQPVSKAMVLGIPPSKTSLRSGPGLLMSRHGHHQGSRTRSWTSAVSCVPCSFKGNIYVTCCYYLLLWFQKGRSRVNHRTMWADIWYAEETSTRTSEVFICVPSFSCDSSYSILRHLESRTFKVRSSCSNSPGDPQLFAWMSWAKSELLACPDTFIWLKYDLCNYVSFTHGLKYVEIFPAGPIFQVQTKKIPSAPRHITKLHTFRRTNSSTSKPHWKSAKLVAHLAIRILCCLPERYGTTFWKSCKQVPKPKKPSKLDTEGLGIWDFLRQIHRSHPIVTPPWFRCPDNDCRPQGVQIPWSSETLPTFLVFTSSSLSSTCSS